MKVVSTTELAEGVAQTNWAKLGLGVGESLPKNAWLMSMVM